MGSHASRVLLVFAFIVAGGWQSTLASEHSGQALYSTPDPADEKIVGGEDMQPGEMPYLVSLQDIRWTPTQPRYFCDGSIKDSNTVITAAHCVQPFARNYLGLEVVAGDYSRSSEEGNEQVMTVKEIIIHPQYDVVSHENDVAILKLDGHLKFNTYVQAAPLPSAGVSVSGACVVAGWGPAQKGGNEADVPHKATVAMLSNNECNNLLDNVFEVTDQMVCSGQERGDEVACESDSGSPLTCDGSCGAYLAGFVSWQFGCTSSDMPTVYTNLEHYLQWLDEA